MKSTMQYSVGGDIIDVADDRRDEFFADYAQDYEGAEPEEVYTYWVNGEPVQVKASRVDEFLADCEADGVEARRTRNFVMDDGQQLRLDDTAARNFVQARRSGMAMSRGLLKQKGIPEQYGRSAAEREALADALAAYYPEEEAEPEWLKEDRAREHNAGTEASRRALGALDTAGQVLKDTWKNLVFAPDSEWGEWLGEQDGVLGNAIRGAIDFSNKAAQAVADIPAAVNDVSAGLVGVGERLAGGDGELERTMRGQSAAYRQGVKEALPTDTAYVDDRLKPVSDMIQNTLVTIGKFALPGMAPVAISADTINSYYDAYEKAKANGASDDKAEALAAAKSGATAAMGLVLGKAAKGARSAAGFKGVLTDMAVTGGEMGALGGVNDIIDQGAEGAENPDWGRVAEATGKEALQGAAFSGISRGVHAIAGAGERSAAKEARRTAQERAEAERKENARTEAQSRYEANLSEEAQSDIDAVVGDMIKTEVIPSWRQAEEVRQKAIEKLGGREKGESHEAVEQAVMEAAQEVQERLQTPARVTSDALERRQTEAKARDNEYWAKRSDELAEQYGAEEAARKVAEEKAAVERKNAADAAAQEEHDARGKEIQGTFDREEGKVYREVEAERKAEMAEYERQEAERKAREEAEQNAPRIDDVTPILDPNGEATTMRDTPEYKAWLKKQGRVDSDKNWNKYVMSHGLDPKLKVDRGRDAKPTEPKVEVSEEMRGKVANDAQMQDIIARARKAESAEEKAALEKEWAKRWGELESGAEDAAAGTTTTSSGTDRATGEPGAPAAEASGGRGTSTPQAPSRAAQEKEATAEGGKPVSSEAEYTKVPDGRGRMVEKPVAKAKPVADTAETPNGKTRSVASETPAPTMDAKAAAKVLGTDAYLPEKDLKAKLAQWEQHAGENAKFAEKAEAAKAMLADRAAKGAATTEEKSVVAEEPKSTQATQETPKVPDGKGRMVEKAAETPVENIEAKNDKTVAEEIAKPQEAPKAASTPTDAGFAAWAVGKDGKPMEFATEAERKQSYEMFKSEVAKGKVDGATGKPIEGGAASATPAKAEVRVPDGKGKMKVAGKKVEAKPSVDTSFDAVAAAKQDKKNGVRVTKRYFGNYDVEIDKDGVTHNFQIRKNNKTGEHFIVEVRKDGDFVEDADVISTVGKHDAFDSKEEIVDYLKDRAKSFVDGDYDVIEDMARRIAEKKTKAYADEIGKMKHLSENDKKAFKKLTKEYEDWYAEVRHNDLTEEEIEDYRLVRDEWFRNGISSDEYVRKHFFEIGSDAQKAADRFIEASDALERFHEQAVKYNGLKRDKKTGRPVLESPKPGSPAAELLGDEAAQKALDEEVGGSPSASPKALNAPPAPLPGSPGNAKLKPNYDPKGGFGNGVKNPVHRQQIIDKVAELFKGKVALRGKGTVSMPEWAGGHFEPGASIIRSKDNGSLDTIPHEIGHFIHFLYEGGAVRKNVGKGIVTPYPNDVGVDLMKMGRLLYSGKVKPSGGYQREGMAELISYYMKGNVEGLKKEAPHAYEWLTRDFAAKHPDVMAKIDEIRDMTDRYQNQTAEQEVRTAIRRDDGIAKRAISKVGGMLKGVANPENWTQENFIDKFAFINKGIRAAGMEDMLDWQGALKRGDAAEASRIIENHPMIKAKLYNGKAGAKAFASLQSGLTTLDGTRRYTYADAGITPPSGKSAKDAIPAFKEIFADIPNDKLDDWQDYALMRVFKENYHARGLKSGVTPESVDKFLNLPQYKNNKVYEKALKDWTDYNHAVLHLLVDGGVMNKATYDKICAGNAIYTKVMRVMDDRGFLGRGRMSNGGKAVNERKGSDRQSEDLFEATLVDHEKIIAAAMQGDLFRSIVNLGNRAEGVGTQGGKTVAPNWIHEVPNAQEAVNFTSGKIRDDFIKRAARHFEDSGEADPSMMTIRGNRIVSEAEDAAMKLYKSMYGINGDKLTIFREKPSSGKNGLISIYDQSGKYRTFELPEVNGEAWAKGLLGMNDGGRESPWESYMKLATEGVKRGATMLNPTFALRNMMRDTLHSATMNEYGKFVPAAGTLEGLAMDLLNTDTKKMYEDMCLGMGTFMGRTKLDAAKNKAGMLRADNWFQREMNKGIVKAVADVVGFSENASRIKEFKNAYEYMKRNGASDTAAKLIAGANALDITVDFQRMGHAMQKANRIIPFVNASVQGIDQFGRAAGLLRSQPWQLNQGSVFESGKRAEGFKKMAKTALKGGVNLTMLSMGAMLYNMSDEERRRKWMELPAHEKWNYVSFGDVRLPVPFELGYVFMSLPSAVIAEMKYGDKGAVAECLETFAKSLPLSGGVRDVALFAPLYSVGTNEDWKGQEIVPQRKIDNLASVDWYGPKTTKAAIALGRAIYKAGLAGEKSWWCAPAYIDTVLDGYSGGMWSRIAKTLTGDVDWSMERKSDMPIIGTFFRRPNTSRVINDFYERAENLTARYNSPSIGVTPEEYGEKVVCDEIKAQLSPIFNENRGIMVSDMPVAKRNDLVDENIKKAQDIVRGIDKSDLRRLGIARAANGLANADASETKIASDKAVLKGISADEAESALRKYYDEWIYDKNKDGKRTGKRHRRMKDPKAIRKRIRTMRERLGD